VLAEIQEGGELDFKIFFKTILSFQKMQVSLINWIFIDFTEQCSRNESVNRTLSSHSIIQQTKQIYQNSNVTAEAM